MSLLDWFSGQPRYCLDDGKCLLKPFHTGFHKAANRIWPNSADPESYWINLGHHLMTVGPIPALSLVEIEYAIAAYRRLGRVPESRR